MISTEIKIELNPMSIQEAIEKLKALDFKNKVNELMERLAEIGVEVIKRKFGETTHVGDNDYSIYYKKEKKKYVIYADGQDVAFIEFGTGNGAWYPETVDISVQPGSWSSTEGTGEYAKYGSWHHKKVKYYGTNPALGFVEAKAEILYQAPIIAREIFK